MSGSLDNLTDLLEHPDRALELDLLLEHAAQHDPPPTVLELYQVLAWCDQEQARLHSKRAALQQQEDGIKQARARAQQMLRREVWDAATGGS